MRVAYMDEIYRDQFPRSVLVLAKCHEEIGRAGRVGRGC